MNPVNFRPIYNNINFCIQNRQSPVSFTANKDSCKFTLIKKLSNDRELNKLLLRCGNNTEEIIKKSLKNYINGGYTADFYDLKDRYGEETGYVISIPKSLLQSIKIDKTYVWGSKFKSTKDEYPGFNFGQCIAQSNGIRIHKKIEGTPSGMTYDTGGMFPEARSHCISNAIFDEKQNMEYEEHIKRLEKLSENQQCFDDFASNIMKMSEIYMFDPFPNNVLVDVDNGRLNIIDPTTKENSIKFQCHGNHLSGMLLSLFDPRYVKKQRFQVRKPDGIPSETNPEHVATRKKVLKNCLIAAKKCGMSFEKNPYEPTSANYHYADLEYLFKIAGISESDTAKILELAKGENNDAFFEFVKSL